jgi:tellurite resistance protein TehA-like permease
MAKASPRFTSRVLFASGLPLSLFRAVAKTAFAFCIFIFSLFMFLFVGRWHRRAYFPVGLV